MLYWAQDKGVAERRTPFFIHWHPEDIGMGVTVKSLFHNGSFLYKMRLAAGRNGLANLVQWVHIIEDDDVSAFLHGGELVFTAGILNKNPEWLPSFTRRLHKAGASAFVVNLGPHTREIQPEVIAYCDEVGMPLFTIPWETRMVDMTRDFCQRIIQAEQTESSLMTALKNILFHIGDQESQILLLERHGFQRNGIYCILCVQAGETEDPDATRTLLKTIAERRLKEMGISTIAFTYNEMRVFLLSGCSPAELDAFLDHFLQQAGLRLPGVALHVGVSPWQGGIGEQGDSFDKAMAALDMARRRNDPLVRYDGLGLFKVLYSVSDRNVLRAFHQEVLGRLEAHDAESGANLCALLRDYLDAEGSLQAVAEKHYIHRNTVTNQLHRIAGLTGYDPLVHADRVAFSLAFHIRSLL